MKRKKAITYICCICEKEFPEAEINDYGCCSDCEPKRIEMIIAANVKRQKYLDTLYE